MELEFEELSPHFSVPFSGHPKLFATLSSYVSEAIRICEPIALLLISEQGSVMPSDAKLSRAGWDNVWESFPW